MFLTLPDRIDEAASLWFFEFAFISETGFFSDALSCLIGLSGIYWTDDYFMRDYDAAWSLFFRRIPFAFKIIRHQFHH